MRERGNEMPNTALKLLVVDDEAPTRQLLMQILKLDGHEVRCAEDGFSALDRIREATPDVLITDLNMPGMSGFELLSVVRRRLPGIYAIASSGAYAGNAVPEGIAADAFHPKASKVQTLLAMVDAAKASVPPERGEAKPTIWISRSQDKISGAACAMISCPECLRALPQMLFEDWRNLHETACVYCDAPVRYAVVPPLDPLTSQPFAGT
jgi:CheY-like chemotaxis protein